MCTTNVYSFVYPDGRKESSHRPTLCAASRHGQPCSNNVVFQHPPQPVQYADASYAPYTNQLPPTPSYTPRNASPNYRSGDETDRSYSSNSSRQRRSSGVYVNGQRVLDLSHRERHARRERIVLVDSPPTPRTPPQTFNGPHTAPSSPNTNATSPSPHAYSSSPRESRRPVIVDERRPRVQIEVIDNGSHSSKHSRHTSTSSRDSRHSHSDDERRRRQREERHREEEELREQKKRARIAKANAEIAGRSAVPVPPAPIKRSPTYTRGTVEVRAAEPDLAEAMRRLTVEEARREDKARQLEEREEEAQRQRLVERMQPKRRATVGPGNRRTRVMYDDGLYRWE